MDVLKELKDELEKKKSELEKELEKTKALLDLINKYLSQQPQIQPQAPEVKEEFKTEKILSKEGEELGILEIGQTKMKLTPTIKFNEDIPPFSSFIIKRVLASLQEQHKINYKIEKDEKNNVKELIIENIPKDNEKIIQELRNSITWSLRRIKERKEVSQ